VRACTNEFLENNFHVDWLLIISQGASKNASFNETVENRRRLQFEITRGRIQFITF
jgi:hypothetical protein